MHVAGRFEPIEEAGGSKNVDGASDAARLSRRGVGHTNELESHHNALQSKGYSVAVKPRSVAAVVASAGRERLDPTGGG